MLIKKIKIFLAVLVLFFPVTVFAATYYVKETEQGNGNGSSYADSMSVSTHNGSSFSGDDIIYLCDTITSQVIVPSSGTSGHVITYRGDYASHAGVLDGVDLGSSASGALLIDTKDFITLYALTIINTTSTGQAHGVRLINAGDITISACTIQYNGDSGPTIAGLGNGIYITGSGSTGWVIEDSDVSYNDGNGLLVDDGNPGGGIIRRNTFDGNGTSTYATYCTDNNTGASFYHNIYIGYQVQTETEIYENKIINGVCGQGIKIKANADIHHNYIADNEDYGIMHIEYSGLTRTQYVWSNIFVITNDSITALQITREGNGTLSVYHYNNTIYGPSNSWNSWDAGMGMAADNSQPVDIYVAKNNIIYNGASRPCFYAPSGSVPTSATIENNLCYGPSTLYVWDGAGKNFTEWQALGFDSPNGWNEDPGLNNVSSSEYWASSGSSVIVDAGDNSLGSSFDDGFEHELALSAFPASVVTVDRDTTGTSGWDLGAYEYGESTATIQGVSITP